MIANIGPIDRSIRIAVGVGLLSLIFLLHGSLRWTGLIGVWPLLSGLLGWCPIYAWLTQD
jgi:Protein of unknown function (DUF2892)